MYARGADTITTAWRRPEPVARKLLRRLAIWSVVIVFAVFGLARVAHGGAAPGYQTVSVGRGETLWSIASDRYPGADTRVKVDEIMKASGLQQPLVYPGQRIKVPNE